MIEQGKIEATANYLIGGLGISISLADITGLFQCLGAIAGAALVILQLCRSLKK